ncbi:hypothetical protein BD560DRAFT_457225 [Blakeslea trispora]|nr:hypothetical protein BD560DRAFT_457225 [Blakeslea trispora]
MKNQNKTKTKGTRKIKHKVPPQDPTPVQAGEILRTLAFLVSQGSVVRQFNDLSQQGTGAPSLQAIVNSEAQVDAILDSGSHGSIISARLAHQLNLKIHKKKDESGSRMADGGRANTLGEVDHLLVTVQDVLMCIRPIVFGKLPYDLLLGNDSMKLMGIAADYSTAYLNIHSDQGLVPLTVHFNQKGRNIIPVQANVFTKVESATSEDSHDTESSDFEESSTEDDAYETYLIFPDSSASESYFVGEGSKSEIEVLAGDVQDQPTTDEKKLKVLQEKVQECDNLNEEQRNKLMEVLSNYLDVFGVNYSDFKQTNLVKLHIDTGDHALIIKRPNKYMSHAELDNLKKELAAMLKTGQIMPTMHLPQKDGKKGIKEGRLVVQFQDLNAILKKDPWPLPSLQHLLETYQGASLFSTLDLLKDSIKS